MPAPLIRIVEGPLYGPDEELLVPAGMWAVTQVPELPDEDSDDDLKPGEVVVVCRSEQEAERKARDILFPPTPVTRLDPLDSLPDGDDEPEPDLPEPGKWWEV